MENKIALMRQHATKVRIHALLVDRYLHAFNTHRPILWDSEEVLAKILEHPRQYRIFQSVTTISGVSAYDLPDPQVYTDFFSLHALNSFQRNYAHCSFFNGCIMDKLYRVIQESLPQLLMDFKQVKQETCTRDSCENQGTEP